MVETDQLVNITNGKYKVVELHGWGAWLDGIGGGGLSKAEVDSQALPADDVRQTGALVIESTTDKLSMGAQLRVRAPQLRVGPDQVNLGTIDLVQLEAGAGADLMVYNVGQGVLMGYVTTGAAWLQVEPAEFCCQTGEFQPLRLSTTNLRIGAHRQILHFISNGGTAQVPISLRVRFSLEPQVVCVPAGEFLRGSEARGKAVSPSEKPQRWIHLDEYWIAKYPVTNAQYAVFVSATGHRAPKHWDGGLPPDTAENHPVVNVNWHDARAYCQWLTEITGKHYLLPTEAQWEKAARGTDGRLFPWGNNWDRQKCNAMTKEQQGATLVGAYSPQGDSPYGCVDMAGNVSEWVFDWYKEDYYIRPSVSENPRGPLSGETKTLRGGSWSDDTRGVRSANRAHSDPTLVSPEIGFRCALALENAEASCLG
ncbi:MAG: formylglycine-generating enzyme family protein [Chloroflexi bacterium]|nr:formylglycine-generating enzyme family protein [Chloroflexota bacterium]